MGSRHHLGLMKTVPLCAAALALPLAAGCSAKSDASATGGKAAKPASLAELAQQTDCSLTGKRKVKDLEQGNCKTSQGRFVLLSFTTDNGMNAWLTEAKPWGGTYLVGARWVAVSQEQTLQSLRKELGGKIVQGDNHGPSHGSGHGAGHG
ncbi:hypothetical protein [Spirillospora sp. CA-128828]|uniref:hypothetical protein n=1 Tax=Spirillospora sp. CA-128828 TaxID=3240033 RepID=UPI003D8C890A